ncbi:unnamed protein product, partial [Discosporangium mesarthrocarpum]
EGYATAAPHASWGGFHEDFQGGGGSATTTSLAGEGSPSHGDRGQAIRRHGLRSLPGGSGVSSSNGSSSSKSPAGLSPPLPSQQKKTASLGAADDAVEFNRALDSTWKGGIAMEEEGRVLVNRRVGTARGSLNGFGRKSCLARQPKAPEASPSELERVNENLRQRLAAAEQTRADAEQARAVAEHSRASAEEDRARVARDLEQVGSRLRRPPPTPGGGETRSPGTPATPHGALGSPELPEGMKGGRER